MPEVTQSLRAAITAKIRALSEGPRAHARVGVSNLWLCIYSVLAVLTGNIFLVLLAQGNESLTAFSGFDFSLNADDAIHISVFVISYCLWILLTWYASDTATSYFTSFMPRNSPETSAVEWQRQRFPLILAYFSIFPIVFALAIALAEVDVAAYALAFLFSLAQVVHLGPLRIEVTLSSTRHLWPFAMLFVLASDGPPLLAFVGTSSVHLSHGVFVGAVVVVFVLLGILAQRNWRRTAIATAGGVALVALAATFALFAKTSWLLLGVLALAQVLWLALRATARAVAATGAGWRVPIALVAIVLALFLGLAFTFFPARSGWILGAPATLLLAVSAWAIAMTLILVFAPKAVGLPSFAALPLVAFGIASCVNDNHSIAAYDEKVNLERATPEKHFKEWLAIRTNDPDRYPVFLVAAAGGGIRAAYWTSLMLSRMDDLTCGEFGRHVYAISGVSGGSLGAAAYVSMLADRGVKNGSEWCKKSRGRAGPDDPLATRTHEFLRRDFLTPIIGNMLLPDALQRLVALRITEKDRGFAMEQSWELAWRESQGIYGHPARFSEPFMDLYEGGKDRTLPSLILNSTRVEDGRRAVASNLAWAPVDSIDLLAKDYATNRLRLSTAVLNSARFPYVSPAGSYFTAPQSQGSPIRYEGRLVDGGYFENSGLASLTEVYDELVKTGFPAENIVVIAIVNDPDSVPVCSAPIARNERKLKSVPALSEAFAPVEAILRAREGRTSFSVRMAARRLTCGKNFVEWGAFKPSANEPPFGPKPAPLGWYLSSRSIWSFGMPSHENAFLFPMEYLDCNGEPGISPASFDQLVLKRLREQGRSPVKGNLQLRQSAAPVCG